ncbi:hypothetical protein S245_070738, partial [Arachis hypogaea]
WILRSHISLTLSPLVMDLLLLMSMMILSISLNRSIKELRENDADGFFNVVAKIKSICNNFDWWSYSCVCGYPLELFRSHFSCSECGRKIKNAVK